MLARRIYGGSKAAMDYDLVPTAVFSPLEYGCVGLSEEEAIAKYGEDSIEVYHQQFKPLELTLPGRGDNASYVKVIVNAKDKERIVGMHYLGWNAGEVIQGFGIALKLKATKEDLDGLVGIHPTSAEIFTTLSVTKRSGGASQADWLTASRLARQTGWQTSRQTRAEGGRGRWWCITRKFLTCERQCMPCVGQGVGGDSHSRCCL